MSLEQERLRIDQLDAELVRLLNERAKTAIRIGLAKSQGTETHVFVPAREKIVLEKVTRLNHGPLSDESIQAIYREIISASIALQKPVVIGYLGPAGTYSHQASLNRFGDSVSYVECETIGEVFSAVESRRVTYGVVPYENSTTGSIAQTLDPFAEYVNVRVRAETFLKIEHALLSNWNLTEIRRIFSHVEAFSQCRKWLESNLPHAEQVHVGSTAQGAHLASTEPHSAAIGSIICAKMLNLQTLVSPCNDRADNTTRFLVLGEDCDAPSNQDKSIMFFTLDKKKPGALCDALAHFKEAQINVLKMDCRAIPSQPWNYYFFVECEGHFMQEPLASVIQTLEKECHDLRVLGSFPSQRS